MLSAAGELATLRHFATPASSIWTFLQKNPVAPYFMLHLRTGLSHARKNLVADYYNMLRHFVNMRGPGSGCWAAWKFLTCL
ncbi:MAG TPA: hypothetical protein DCF61_12840 [Alphaproteobacteria bacterium]|nr:hypothetical protein [Alphaproteobacteria bacterium]HAM46625.1 hypothetical protein [Alphaproteobacteria bacterium]